MYDTETIVFSRIVLPSKFGDRAYVMVKYSPFGDEKYLFSYFADEISFTADELCGLTSTQAVELLHTKDMAYLTQT